MYQPLAAVCERRRTLLVLSPSTLPLVRVLDGMNITATEILSRDGAGALPGVESIEVVAGLGGGSVMDAAKLRGARLGLPVICIPSILSTDAFLTSSAAVRQGGRLRYEPTGAPGRVVIDAELLGAAPARLNVMGCADVLSMLTACEDWRRDPGSQADEGAVREATAICGRLLASVDAIAAGSRDGLQAVLDGLVAEVELCARYGTGRIEEGSEHYFAYALERRAPGLMHGALVALGIIVSRVLQGQPIGELQSFFRRTDIAAGWQALSQGALTETLLAMPAFVKEEQWAASVWDQWQPDRAVATALALSVLEGCRP